MLAYLRQLPPWLMPFLLILLTLAGLVVLLVTLGVEVAAAGVLVVTLTTATVRVVLRLSTNPDTTPNSSSGRPVRRRQAGQHQPGGQRNASGTRELQGLERREPVDGAKG